MRKLTYKYVKSYFDEQKCELIEKEYINNNIKMKYLCRCGDIKEISFNKFKRSKKCRKCNGKDRFSIKYIKQYFKDNNCELLEKIYKNNSEKMRYKCECGNISKINFDHFKRGQRCNECKIEKISGKNNCNYNPNLTDEERERNKTRLSDPLYKKWREQVFKRDKYLCQKCFKKKRQINAHHIESWDNNKKLRLVKSNAITFCEDCHKKFHKKYGYKDSNRQKLNKFLKG